MKIPCYLSMTATEFTQCSEFPKYAAWMACHFSPYGTGLTNIPSHLPKGTLLILNDRTPVHGHEPKQIRQSLEDTVTALGCCAVLLDLQRADCGETDAIVKEILTLPFPVCVSEIYAKELDCPIFLPPTPLTLTPAEYLSPWKGRDIWLDITTECSVFTVAENGSHSSLCKSTGDFPFHDAQRYCHYRTELKNNTAHFYLHRTKEDLADLLNISADFGVTKAVGLWQELK